MSMLSDFLNENGVKPEDVVARSQALEKLNTEDRALRNKRTAARREKKTYEETEAKKPGSLGRGVTMRTMKSALEGQPVTRISRKKIARAVNSLLKSAKKDEVEWRKLFQDSPSRKGKKK
jgi:hypothetical protein